MIWLLEALKDECLCLIPFETNYDVFDIIQMLRRKRVRYFRSDTILEMSTQFYIVCSLKNEKEARSGTLPLRKNRLQNLSLSSA